MKLSKFLLLLFIICLSPAYGQTSVGSFLSASSEKITTTNFYYARPNDLTIIVNVVGFVQRPGRYEVASNIDLVNLLSLAGGPTSDGAMNKVNITRIIKEGDKVHRTDIKFNLEDLTAVKSEDLVLAPGDVVTIERTSWATFRDAFSVVVSGAIIVTAVSQVLYVTKK